MRAAPMKTGGGAARSAPPDAAGLRQRIERLDALPRPGARLLRDWRGTRHEVHVTHTGYFWQGKSFGSLSSVAKAITGVNRNGPAFFGLRTTGEGS